ncbi:YceG family protein [Bacteriovorax sp. BAL6_X]|uniref:endolytic transglycosylase MltG n=1 Tax=Bacteriovorax sp. BAL6_X TaxID=1201290 RepID=UPI0003866C3D|nr:endolytic transglycosylase MltG [Bacteriovorax sp. BAL6_X]EPZ49991.1 YceG family protein [Bacteriovorax sp. BAL6_X]
MTKKNLFIFLVLAPALSICLLVAHTYYNIYHWQYGGPETEFQINSGDTFGTINYRLAQDKIIYSPRLFHRYVKFEGKLTSFKAGRYIIPKGITMDELLALLISGKSLTVRVTIPEGYNLFQIAKALADEKIVDEKDFIKEAKDKKFVHSLGIPAGRVEGYLYPDTYQFHEKMKARAIIHRMYDNFKDKTKDLDFSKVRLTKHQLVTLASMVEKETGAKFERPTISGVFHNRLKKRMRLQSDPTTIYGIWESYKGNISKKHLRQKTPYNTYKISGLPVGPIANPGLAALKAALNPKKHDFLYFVSKNDGTHVFSKTYKKHSQAVDFWQKNRANRKGRSWRDLNKKQ